MISLFDKDRWQEIWMTITQNKTRSVLTAFGVFWGIFMLVLLQGAGSALNKGVMSSFDGFATNTCFIMPQPTKEAFGGFQKGRVWNITNADIEVLRHRVPGLAHISPILVMWTSKDNVYYGDKRGNYNVNGCMPEFEYIQQSDFLFGRFINDIDVAEKRKVCVIGKEVHETLFGKEVNPVGKSIKVDGIYYQIVGVSAKKGEVNINGDSDRGIMLPFTTMQQTYNMGNNVQMIGAVADPDKKVTEVQLAMEEVLRQQHQLSPTDDEAIESINFEEEFAIFQNLRLGVMALIWIVGIGTLLAGAIGVSNIMLVTVKERTREIGIRRALGATPTSIISQILSESVLLTLLAGVMGMMLGISILSVVGMALESAESPFKDPQISFSMAVGALTILLVIGTLAGFIPAQRAMNIKPIEAIREE